MRAEEEKELAAEGKEAQRFELPLTPLAGRLTQDLASPLANRVEGKMHEYLLSQN